MCGRVGGGYTGTEGIRPLPALLYKMTDGGTSRGALGENSLVETRAADSIRLPWALLDLGFCLKKSYPISTADFKMLALQSYFLGL